MILKANKYKHGGARIWTEDENGIKDLYADTYRTDATETVGLIPVMLELLEGCVSSKNSGNRETMELRTRILLARIESFNEKEVNK